MKIALISDIHISQSLSWTQSVWEAFLHRVEEKNPSLVIIGGDLFDSIDDAYALREWFRETLEETTIPRFLWVAGNHDLTNPTTQRQHYTLSDMDFGNKVTLCLTPDLYLEEDVEILVYPFPLVHTERERELFSPSRMLSYFPPPQQPRIAVGHVALSSFLPQLSEEPAVIPSTFATMFQCKQVFLGHIHQVKQEGVYQTIGSARVWRKGEEGPRRYLLYDTNTNQIESEELPEGRVFEEIEAFVWYDHIDDTIGKDFSPHTWLHIKLYGVVQNDNDKEKIKNELRQRYPHIAELTFDEENLFLSSLLAYHPLWQIFVTKWQKSYDQSQEQEKPLWLLARKLFVREFFKQGGRRV